MIDLTMQKEKPVRESIIVVSPWLYHPACGNGGGVLCFNLIQRLASSYDVHFISFDQSANDPEGGRRALNAFCSSVSTVPVPATIGKSSKLWLKQIFTGEPREAQALNSVQMRDQIKAAVDKYQPTVVVLQFPQTAQVHGRSRLGSRCHGRTGRLHGLALPRVAQNSAIAQALGKIYYVAGVGTL